jgi:hypothetical protein
VLVQPIYTYEVADLRTGVRFGDLPLTGVRYGKRLNDSGTLTGQFQIESRNAEKRQVEDAYDWTTPAKRSLTVYRDERPVWGGIIWTSNYNSAQGTVTVGAGDYWSYFDHRYVLPVLALTPRPGANDKAPSIDYVATRLTTYTGVDQNLIARNLVTLAQSHTGGSLGIVMDSSLSAVTRDRVYEGHQLIAVGEALRELTAVLGGPDLLFDVVGVDAQGRPIRTLLQGDPYLGTQSSTHTFEYGANLVHYTWPRDGTSMATRQFANGDGTAEGALIAASENTTAYTSDGGGWPLLEGEQQYSGVLLEQTLQDHADGQQGARRRPVVLPKFTVRGDMSPTVGEWQLGDDARATIEDDWFRLGVEAPVRIVGADISPGGTEDGTELVELTVSPLLDDLLMGV